MADMERAVETAQEWVAQRSNVTDKGYNLARAFLALKESNKRLAAEWRNKHMNCGGDCGGVCVTTGCAAYETCADQLDPEVNRG